MAFSYFIDPTRCRVTVVATEQLTRDEFVRLMTNILRDPAFEPGFDILWDRQSYNAIPSREYVEAVAKWWRQQIPLLGHGRVANVVPATEPAVYGMARMAELLFGPEGYLRAFRDLDEAVRWLDERFASDAPGERPCADTRR